MIDSQETLHFLDYWRIVQSRKEVVLAVSLLVVMLGIIYTYSAPKEYMSSVVIQVQKETPDLAVFAPTQARYDPLYIRTQFEIIQSDPILEEVVRRMDLAEKFSKAYSWSNLSKEEVFINTLAKLNSCMKVQQYRDTELIEIQIYFSKPEEHARFEAAKTANMVASVFREKNLERVKSTTERGLEVLYDALQEQRQKVVEAEDKVEAIRKEYQISESFSIGGDTITMDRKTLEYLESERVRVVIKMSSTKARFDTLTGLSAKKLLASARTLVGDTVLDTLVAQRSQAEVELEMNMQAYGKNHPEVVKVKSGIKELNAKIDEALIGLRTSVASEYDSAKATLNMLETRLKAVKTKEIEAEGVGYRKFDRAKEELHHFRAIRDSLEERHVKESIEVRMPMTMVEVIDPAEPSQEEAYVKPKKMLNIVLSIIFGLGCGIGLAYFIEYLDTSVKTIKDVEDYMDVPVVGVVPQKVKAFCEAGANTDHAEAYRMLRTNIHFSKRVESAKAVAVTSGSVGEGKSTTAFNLAYVCASLGDNVLIVDADLHRPRQHKVLGVSNSVGLANILAGDVGLEDSIVATDYENLDFLPSGVLSYEVHGLLDTRIWSEIVTELKANYDIVIFDAPPVIGVSDTSLVVREMDGVLLVIQHRKYPKSVSSRAKEMLDNLSVDIIGVVMNNINISRDYSSYYPAGAKYYYTRGK